VLSDRGFHVFGSVRKAEDAASLTAEFGDACTPLVFDVTDEPAVRAAATHVEARLDGATLAGLINNAGIAVAGPLMHVPTADLRHQFDVNVIAQVVVTRAFLPALGATNPPREHPGRIVNMSSVGGRSAMPFIGPYASTKFALEGLSEALRRELMIYGIDVIVVAPGAIATPIWDKAAAIDVAPLDATDYGPALHRTKDVMVALGTNGLPAETVGDVVHRALTHPRPKVRYTIAPNPIQMWLRHHLPKRLVDRLIARRLGMTRLGA